MKVFFLLFILSICSAEYLNPLSHILTLDCDGGVSVLAKSPFEIKANISQLMPVFELMAETVHKKAQCQDPDLSYKEFLQGIFPSFDYLMNTFTANRGDWYMDPTTNFYDNFFTIMSASPHFNLLNLPESCSFDTFNTTGQCSLLMNFPELYGTIQLDVQKCGEDKLFPYVDINLDGDLVDYLGKLCFNDSDCGDNFACADFGMTFTDLVGMMNEMMNETMYDSYSPAPNIWPDDFPVPIIFDLDRIQDYTGDEGVIPYLWHWLFDFFDPEYEFQDEMRICVFPALFEENGMDKAITSFLLEPISKTPAVSSNDIPMGLCSSQSDSLIHETPSYGNMLDFNQTQFFSYDEVTHHVSPNPAIMGLNIQGITESVWYTAKLASQHEGIHLPSWTKDDFPFYYRQYCTYPEGLINATFGTRVTGHRMSFRDNNGNVQFSSYCKYTAPDNFCDARIEVYVEGDNNDPVYSDSINCCPGSDQCEDSGRGFSLKVRDIYWFESWGDHQFSVCNDKPEWEDEFKCSYTWNTNSIILEIIEIHIPQDFLSYAFNETNSPIINTPVTLGWEGFYFRWSNYSGFWDSSFSFSDPDLHGPHTQTGPATLGYVPYILNPAIMFENLDPTPDTTRTATWKYDFEESLTGYGQIALTMNCFTSFLPYATPDNISALIQVGYWNGAYFSPALNFSCKEYKEEICDPSCQLVPQIAFYVNDIEIDPEKWWGNWYNDIWPDDSSSPIRMTTFTNLIGTIDLVNGFFEIDEWGNDFQTISSYKYSFLTDGLNSINQVRFHAEPGKEFMVKKMHVCRGKCLNHHDTETRSRYGFYVSQNSAKIDFDTRSTPPMIPVSGVPVIETISDTSIRRMGKLSQDGLVTLSVNDQIGASLHIVHLSSLVEAFMNTFRNLSDALAANLTAEPITDDQLRVRYGLYLPEFWTNIFVPDQDPDYDYGFPSWDFRCLVNVSLDDVMGTGLSSSLFVQNCGYEATRAGADCVLALDYINFPRTFTVAYSWKHNTEKPIYTPAFTVDVYSSLVDYINKMESCDVDSECSSSDMMCFDLGKEFPEVYDDSGSTVDNRTLDLSAAFLWDKPIENSCADKLSFYHEIRHFATDFLDVTHTFPIEVDHLKFCGWNFTNWDMDTAFSSENFTPFPLFAPSTIDFGYANGLEYPRPVQKLVLGNWAIESGMYNLTVACTDYPFLVSDDSEEEYLLPGEKRTLVLYYEPQHGFPNDADEGSCETSFDILSYDISIHKSWITSFVAIGYNASVPPSDFNIPENNVTFESMDLIWTSPFEEELNDCEWLEWEILPILGEFDPDYNFSSGCYEYDPFECSVTGLLSDTLYQFSLRAICNFSLANSEIVYTPIVRTLYTPVSQPGEIQFNEIYPHNFSISWKSPTTFGDCNFTRWNFSSNLELAEGALDLCYQASESVGSIYSCQITSLPADTFFSFQVQALCENFHTDSPFSNVNSSTTSYISADVLALPSLSLVTFYTVDIDWVNGTLNDCIFTQWEFSSNPPLPSSSFDACVALSVNDTSCTITDLIPDTDYSFQVRPSCTHTNPIPDFSPAELIHSVPLPADDPEIVNLVSSSHSLTLSWKHGSYLNGFGNCSQLAGANWDFKVYFNTGDGFDINAFIPLSCSDYLSSFLSYTYSCEISEFNIDATKPLIAGIDYLVGIRRLCVREETASLNWVNSSVVKTLPVVKAATPIVQTSSPLLGKFNLTFFTSGDNDCSYNHAAASEYNGYFDYSITPGSWSGDCESFPLPTLAGTRHDCTVDNLGSDTQYRVNVRQVCWNTLATSDWSEDKTIWTDHTDATTPSITSVFDIKHHSVNISVKAGTKEDCDFKNWEWDYTENPLVCNSQTSIPDFSDCIFDSDRLDTFECIITSLKSDTAYNFSVREKCINDYASSKPSGVMLPQITSAYSAGVPTASGLTEVSQNSVQITFQNASQGDCCFSQFEFSSYPEADLAFYGSCQLFSPQSSDIICTISGLYPYTEYSFQVKETCSNSDVLYHVNVDSDWSSSSPTARTLPLLPLEPVITNIALNLSDPLTMIEFEIMPGVQNNCTFDYWDFEFEYISEQGKSAQYPEYECFGNICVVSNLTSDTEYAFRARETCSNIDSSSFSVLSSYIKTDAVIASVPSSFDAIQYGKTNMSLTWTANSAYSDCLHDGFSFASFYGDGDFSNCISLRRGDTLECVVTGLDSDTLYNFTIFEICTNTYCNSNTVTSNSVLTLYTPVSPPFNVIASNSIQSLSSLQLDWDFPSDVQDCDSLNFEFESNTNASEDFSSCLSQTRQSDPIATSFTCTVTNLDSDEGYRFRVKEICDHSYTSSQFSNWSPIVMTYYTPANDPTMVVSSNSTSISTLEFYWEYDPNTDCDFDSFIFYSEPAGGNFSDCYFGAYDSPKSCTVTELTSDTSYVFYVAATCSNSYCNSNYVSTSPVKTYYVPSDTPSNFVINTPVKTTWPNYDALLEWEVQSFGDCIDPTLHFESDNSNVSLSECEMFLGYNSPFSCWIRNMFSDTIYSFNISVICSNSYAKSLSYVTSSTTTGYEAAFALTDLQGSNPTLDSITLSWKVNELRDCNDPVYDFQQVSGSGVADFSECLVQPLLTSCNITDLATNTFYSFAIRIICTNSYTNSNFSIASPDFRTNPLPATKPTSVSLSNPLRRNLTITLYPGQSNDCTFLYFDIQVASTDFGEIAIDSFDECKSLPRTSQFVCSINNLQPDTYYSFIVREACTDSLANSEFSFQSLPETTDHIDALPPQNIYIVPGSPTRTTLEISWTPSIIEDDCKFLYYNFKSNNLDIPVSAYDDCQNMTGRFRENFTSCIISQLQGDTTYRFGMRTICSNTKTNSDWSSYSDFVSTTYVIADSPIITETNVSGTTSIDFSWIPGSSPGDCFSIGWEFASVPPVELDTSECVDLIREAELDELTCTLGNLVSDTLYTFTVRELCNNAYCNSEISIPSDPILTDCIAAVSPFNLTASAPTASSVKLQWQPGSEANDCIFDHWEFNVTLGSVSINSFTQCEAISSRDITVCTVYTLPDETDYRFIVRESCSNTERAFSEFSAPSNVITTLKSIPEKTIAEKLMSSVGYVASVVIMALIVIAACIFLCTRCTSCISGKDKYQELPRSVWIEMSNVPTLPDEAGSVSRPGDMITYEMTADGPKILKS